MAGTARAEHQNRQRRASSLRLLRGQSVEWVSVLIGAWGNGVTAHVCRNRVRVECDARWFPVAPFAILQVRASASDSTVLLQLNVPVQQRRPDLALVVCERPTLIGQGSRVAGLRRGELILGLND